MKEKVSNSSYNLSTEKAVSLLELLSKANEPLRLSDIAESVDLNVSTVHRFLNSFIKLGYVNEDPLTQRYYITYKICKLSNAILSSKSINTVTHPFLVEVSDYFKESACISVLENMEAVYVDVATSNNRILMSRQYLGNAVALHSTGNGKIILSYFDDNELDAYIEKKGLKKFTKYTLVDKKKLKAELEEIRENGYAIDNQEGEIGVRCLACPIFDYTQRNIGGISVTGPTDRMTDEFILERVQYLKNVADKISAALGYEKNT